MHLFPSYIAVCPCNTLRTTAVACRASTPESSSHSTPQRSIRKAYGADRTNSPPPVIVKPIIHAATTRTLSVQRCGFLAAAAAARQEGLQDRKQQQSLGQDSAEDVDSLDNEGSWDDAVSAGDEGEEEGEDNEEEADEAPAVMSATAAKERPDIPMSQTQVAYIPVSAALELVSQHC